MRESNSSNDNPYGDIIDDPNELRQFSDYKKVFSHQTLVMMAYTTALNAGCKEMKKGFWETKQDKYGNISNIYNADTRHEFINAVKMLETVTHTDIEKSFNDKIDKAKSNLEEKRKQLSEQEHVWWTHLSHIDKTKVPHLQGALNQELMYYQMFVNEMMQVYQEILRYTEQGLKDIDYYSQGKITLSGDLPPIDAEPTS